MQSQQMALATEAQRWLRAMRGHSCHLTSTQGSQMYRQRKGQDIWGCKNRLAMANMQPNLE